MPLKYGDLAILAKYGGRVGVSPKIGTLTIYGGRVDRYDDVH